MSDAPTRSIVIVNWNAGDDLGRCLDSVADEAAAGQEVIVVDNASTDGSTAAAVATRPWVRVVQHAENLGFAAGANAGAAVATGAAVVFLNPDAEVEPGAVATLAAAVTGPASSLASVVIAGGGLRDPDGGWQPGAARFAPFAHLLLDTTLGRWRSRGRTEAYAVDWVYGTFIAVRASAFDALGGFDTRYFCYGEDLDLCWRARQGGGAVVHVPAARAVHGHNVSAAQRFGRTRDAEVVKGELRFYHWRLGRLAAARYRTLAMLKFGLKRVACAALGRREQAAVSAAIVDACLRFRVP